MKRCFTMFSLCLFAITGTLTAQPSTSTIQVEADSLRAGCKDVNMYKCAVGDTVSYTISGFLFSLGDEFRVDSVYIANPQEFSIDLPSMPFYVGPNQKVDATLHFFPQKAQPSATEITIQTDSESMISFVVGEGLTAVSAQDAAPTSTEFRLWPNPAQGLLRINIPEGIQGEVAIQITDLTGRLFYTEQIHQESGLYSLSLHTIPEGIYFVRLRSDISQQIIPFCIQR